MQIVEKKIFFSYKNKCFEKNRRGRDMAIKKRGYNYQKREVRLSKKRGTIIKKVNMHNGFLNKIGESIFYIKSKNRTFNTPPIF